MARGKILHGMRPSGLQPGNLPGTLAKRARPQDNDACCCIAGGGKNTSDSPAKQPDYTAQILQASRAKPGGAAERTISLVRRLVEPA